MGILHSLTGTLLDHEKPITYAVQLAIDEINDAGGVLGQSLVGVQRDGRSDENIFAKEAARLFEDESVAVLFG